ncbi:MAG: hypothetical protein R3A12_08795 [Ignavibacteria bacterium]
MNKKICSSVHNKAERRRNLSRTNDNESEYKEELIRYFRSMNQGLMTMLHDSQKPPLVLCCLDYYYPIK